MLCVCIPPQHRWNRQSNFARISRAARGLRGQGNIRIHCHKRQRYRCRICGQTFSARRSTLFAVHLCVAAEQLRKEMHTPRPPPEQARYDHTLNAARQALGPDAYEQAWATGATLPLQEAIAFGLSDLAS